MQAIVTMFTQRPYVIAFLATFAILAWSERGSLRTFLWFASGVFLGWLSEFSSVSTGFPFGMYAYHKEQFARELWLGPVPLFASLSFSFMSYFSFSAARRLLAPWNRQGAGISARVEEAIDLAPRTMLVAAVIGTWMDTVIDPMTLIGHHWFLGDLYHYDPPGPHFGVPISNYGGWLVTIGGIVLANQMIDRLLARLGVRLSRGPALPLESFWGIGCCVGVFAFIVGVNVVLLAKGTLPAEIPLSQILLSGMISFALFLAFIVVMVRRGFTQSGPDPLSARLQATARS